MDKQTIIAAGGLVVNENNELLFIFRRGYWDLPKGKLDDGESIETCAVREVQEETGLQNVELVSFLCKTYHEYFDKWVGAEVIKESHWYVMKASINEKLIPQTEEDIEQIVWANKTMVDSYSENTYPSILEVLAAYELEHR
jgi:8-oxo-dGTP pyrophosphatase MutT (NUDIX family)